MFRIYWPISRKYNNGTKRLISLERGLYIDLAVVCVIECTAFILKPMEERLHFPQDGTLNTLWTGDADLRLYVTTVQDG